MISHACSQRELHDFFGFVIPDIGYDEYKRAILKRAQHNGQPTALIDPDLWLPPSVRPPGDVFCEALEPSEAAWKFISFLAILKGWSRDIPGDTRSSFSRRIYLQNVLMLQFLEQTFVRPNEKLQFDSGTVLRINMKRKPVGRIAYDLEDALEKAGLYIRKKERVSGKLVTENVSHNSCMEQAIKIVRKDFNLPTRELQDLRSLWWGLIQGYPPTYPAKRQTFGETANWLHIEKSELGKIIDRHLRYNPFCMESSEDTNAVTSRIAYIENCGTLEGRRMSLIQDNTRCDFAACYRCKSNQNCYRTCDPSLNIEMCQKKMKPVGHEIPAPARNELPTTARRSIAERDKNTCLICRALGQPQPPGRMHFGHCISAFLTTHALTERDGFQICQPHNSNMYDLGLEDFCPEAVPLARQLGLAY